MDRKETSGFGIGIGLHNRASRLGYFGRAEYRRCERRSIRPATLPPYPDITEFRPVALRPTLCVLSATLREMLPKGHDLREKTFLRSPGVYGNRLL